jgi:hypothetical protein
MLATVLERVIAFAARDEPELMRAREEWDERAGRVFHDDPLYEERTTAFLEWYALERLGVDGRTPAERLRGPQNHGPSDELQERWIAALTATHRSLFAVREQREGELLLDDLLGGGAFLVAERRRLPGIEEGEILEARLTANVATPPELLFTRAFQFHPAEAKAELKRQAQAAREAKLPRDEALFRLLRLRLKALRYRHVSADRIYRGDGAQ